MAAVRIRLHCDDVIINSLWILINRFNFYWFALLRCLKFIIHSFTEWSCQSHGSTDTPAETVGTGNTTKSHRHLWNSFVSGGLGEGVLGDCREWWRPLPLALLIILWYSLIYKVDCQFLVTARMGKNYPHTGSLLVKLQSPPINFNSHKNALQSTSWLASIELCSRLFLLVYSNVRFVSHLFRAFK